MFDCVRIFRAYFRLIKLSDKKRRGRRKRPDRGSRKDSKTPFLSDRKRMRTDKSGRKEDGRLRRKSSRVRRRNEMLSTTGPRPPDLSDVFSSSIGGVYFFLLVQLFFSQSPAIVRYWLQAPSGLSHDRSRSRLRLRDRFLQDG